MTKTEIEKRIKQIVDATYEIQDRIKEDGPVEWSPDGCYCYKIDEQYFLKRTKTRYEICDSSGQQIRHVIAAQDFLTVLSSLIERYLKIIDS